MFSVTRAPRMGRPASALVTLPEIEAVPIGIRRTAVCADAGSRGGAGGGFWATDCAPSTGQTMAKTAASEKTRFIPNRIRHPLGGKSTAPRLTQALRTRST